MTDPAEDNPQGELQLRLGIAQRSRELGAASALDSYINVINQGRIALALIGLLHIGCSAYFYYMLHQLQVDPPASPLVQARTAAAVSNLFRGSVLAGMLGFFYLGARRLAFRRPIAAFGSALAIFLGDTIWLGYMHPDRLSDGFILRILIVGSLLRSLLAGITKDRRHS